MSTRTTRRVALTSSAIKLVFVAGLLLVSTSSQAAAAAAAGGMNFTTLYDLLHNTPELSAALELFNYTGLLPLTQHPNTTITCFLPSSKHLDAGSLIQNWEDTSIINWSSPERPRRYVWALLLHHCLDGPRAITLASLASKTSYAYYYDSAFVMRGLSWSAGLVKAKVAIKKTSGSPNVIFEGEQFTEGKVITADLRGGKSVVHIIDSGIMIPVIAPPDTYSFLSQLLEFNPTTAAVFAASSLDLDNPTRPFTVFLPDDNAWSSLLKMFKIELPQLLSRPALVDLLVRAHVVNGSALFTGSLISFPGPLVLKTLAGPVNVTTDLSIFPDRRPGSARFLTLATSFSSALLGDYDVGGNGNGYGNDYDVPPAPQWVAHYLNKVLLPVSTASLRKMLLG